MMRNVRKCPSSRPWGESFGKRWKIRRSAAPLHARRDQDGSLRCRKQSRSRNGSHGEGITVFGRMESSGDSKERDGVAETQGNLSPACEKNRSFFQDQRIRCLREDCTLFRFSRHSRKREKIGFFTHFLCTTG